MNHLSRLISLLTLLKARRILTSTEISQKFDISVRTAYRDIKKLEDAGVPVMTIEGRGYALMDDYTVPPIAFTEKEANALITAEQLINHSNDQSLISNFAKALVKIQSVFKHSIRAKGELLKHRMLVLKHQDKKIESYSLTEIQLAITNFRYLEIDYRKAGGLEHSLRLVEPCAIYCAQEKWILVAWCHLRKDYRAFRIDRIVRFQVLMESFEDRKFDLRKYFLSCPQVNYHP